MQVVLNYCYDNWLETPFALQWIEKIHVDRIGIVGSGWWGLESCHDLDYMNEHLYRS